MNSALIELLRAMIQELGDRVEVIVAERDELRRERDDEYDYTGGLASHHVEWTYEKSFRLESDAEAYAERLAENYEFVKIEKKESE